MPAAMGAPVYANRKVIRASMSGVAVGTIVDYSYTTTKTQSWVPGDFYQWWGVSTGLSVQALPVHRRRAGHGSDSGSRSATSIPAPDHAGRATARC